MKRNNNHSELHVDELGQLQRWTRPARPVSLASAVETLRQLRTRSLRDIGSSDLSGVQALELLVVIENLERAVKRALLVFLALVSITSSASAQNLAVGGLVGNNLYGLQVMRIGEPEIGSDGVSRSRSLLITASRIDERFSPGRHRSAGYDLGLSVLGRRDIGGSSSILWGGGLSLRIDSDDEQSGEPIETESFSLVLNLGVDYRPTNWFRLGLVGSFYVPMYLGRSAPALGDYTLSYSVGPFVGVIL